MSKQQLAKGMGASPGKATGVVVFDGAEAVRLASDGASVILMRIDATAEDVPAMKVASGIVTTRGGITGDAAIVARTLGKPCIASCSAVRIDYASETFSVWHDAVDASDVVVSKGTTVTIDGATGELWLG